jgi:hypothetical protein
MINRFALLQQRGLPRFVFVAPNELSLTIQMFPVTIYAVCATRFYLAPKGI